MKIGLDQKNKERPQSIRRGIEIVHPRQIFQEEQQRYPKTRKKTKTPHCSQALGYFSVPTFFAHNDSNHTSSFGCFPAAYQLRWNRKWFCHANCRHWHGLPPGWNSNFSTKAVANANERTIRMVPRRQLKIQDGLFLSPFQGNEGSGMLDR